MRMISHDQECATTESARFDFRGAMVDLPTRSVAIGGLELWDMRPESFQTISEPRLRELKGYRGFPAERSLSFRSPPIGDGAPGATNGTTGMGRATAISPDSRPSTGSGVCHPRPFVISPSPGSGSSRPISRTGFYRAVAYLPVSKIARPEGHDVRGASSGHGTRSRRKLKNPESLRPDLRWWPEERPDLYTDP